MKLKTWLTLGAIIIVVYLAWKWASNNLFNQQSQAPQGAFAWAPPVAYPGPIRGWSPYWYQGYTGQAPYPRGGPGRRRGPVPYAG